MSLTRNALIALLVACTASLPAVAEREIFQCSILAPIASTTGSIGIGIANPSFALDVQGVSGSASGIYATRFSTDANSASVVLRKSRGATVGSRVTVDTSDNLGAVSFAGDDGSAYDLAGRIKVLSGTVSAGNIPGIMVFETANSSGVITERLRVDSSGNLGIGTTGPSYQLQLSTDSAAKPTTNTWTIASDSRIKTNVAAYTKGLAEIKQVNPVTYDYNGKGGIPAGPGGVSIIAQDLQPVFPECVGTYRGKLNPEDAEETDIYNYNGHAITFALINATKELAAKVEALEARVAALEN